MTDERLLAALEPDIADRRQTEGAGGDLPRVTTEVVPVLWFDRKGCGPDELGLQLHHFPSEMDGGIPASLGIRVRAGGIVIGAGPLVDGGFNLGREQAATLHRLLGEWLAANTPRDAT